MTRGRIDRPGSETAPRAEQTRYDIADESGGLPIRNRGAGIRPTDLPQEPIRSLPVVTMTSLATPDEVWTRSGRRTQDEATPGLSDRQHRCLGGR